MKNPYIITLTGYHKCSNHGCIRPAIFGDTFMNINFCSKTCYNTLKEDSSIHLVNEYKKCQNNGCKKISVFHDDMLDLDFCSKECYQSIMDSLSFKSVIGLLKGNKK